MIRPLRLPQRILGDSERQFEAIWRSLEEIVRGVNAADWIEAVNVIGSEGAGGGSGLTHAQVMSRAALHP